MSQQGSKNRRSFLATFVALATGVAASPDLEQVRRDVRLKAARAYTQRRVHSA